MSENEAKKINQNTATPLSEQEKVRQFFALKAELEQASAEAEAGAYAPFDPKEFESKA